MEIKNSTFLPVSFLLTALYMGLSSCQHNTDRHTKMDKHIKMDKAIMYDSIRFVEVNRQKFDQLLKYKSQIGNELTSTIQRALVQDLQSALPKSFDNINWKDLSYIRYLSDLNDLSVSQEGYSSMLGMAHVTLDECEDQLKNRNSIDPIMNEALLDQYLFKCSSQFSDSWYMQPKVGFPIGIAKELLSHNPSTYKDLFNKDQLEPFHLTEQDVIGYADIDDPINYYYIRPKLIKEMHSFFLKTRSESKPHEQFFNMFSRALNRESVIIVDL